MYMIEDIIIIIISFEDLFWEINISELGVYSLII